jgi:hypothetical protein
VRARFTETSTEAMTALTSSIALPLVEDREDAR